MITPVEVKRDNHGEWCHPQLDTFFGDREAVSGAEFDAWKVSHGIETTSENLGDEYPKCLAYETYYEEGDPDISGWNPQAPGNDWRTLAIYDTENGPMVIWYREVKPS